MSQERVAVAIPCLNEAMTIGKVVSDFRRVLPEARVIVFDNNSDDETVSRAQENGAEVVVERQRGKGRVMQRVFREVCADILIVVDGDDTYDAEDAFRLIAPLRDGHADMVVGNRFTQSTRKGFTWAHRLGNIVFRGLLNILFGTKHSDILSGYRALRRDFYKNIPLLSVGFEVETELTLQALERGYEIREVRIGYKNRPKGSHSKIREFQDGSKIVLTIISLLRDYRPMSFFSWVSGFFLALGLISGSVVVTEYLRTGFISRVPMTILTIALILIGIHAFISGLILSAVNRRHREMEAMIRRLNP